MSIIAISCNNPTEIFKEYYIEDLDELFDVYLKEEMKTDYQIRRHLQILKSNNFTYDDFLKLSNIDLFKFNIPQEYVLFYLCIRDKELTNRHTKKEINFDFLSENIGGFVGKSIKSDINDSTCEFEG